jgi:hypothetical protein
LIPPARCRGALALVVALAAGAALASPAGAGWADRGASGYSGPDQEIEDPQAGASLLSAMRKMARKGIRNLDREAGSARRSCRRAGW